MSANSGGRPKPAKWVPRDHPNYIQEMEKVDVPLARVLGATLFVRPKAAGEKDALLHLWHRFLARADPSLQWWYDSNNERLRPYEDRYREFPERVLSTKLKSLTHWAVHSGDRARDAAKVEFRASIHAAAKDPAGLDQLDTVFWSMADRSSPQELLDEALAFARLTALRHGTLGLSLALPALSKWPHYYGEMFALCHRYQGFDLPETFERARCIKGISTTNWVTFVHNTFLKRIGGMESLRKRLSSEIVFHEILDGVAIQAGASPSVGDVNAGEALPLYREVARALSSIRAKVAYDDSQRHLGGPDYQRNNFNTQETAEWLARFER